MNDDPKMRLIELPLLIFFCSLSASSLLYKLFLIFNVSFSFGVWALLMAVLISALTTALLALKSVNFNFPVSGRLIFNALCLVALGGTGAMLAASINRPDIDDAAYVPKLVYYMEHPRAPIDSAITSIAYGDGILRSPIAAMPYEFLQAAFAHALGIHFLDFYHIVFPAVVGGLIVLSVFLLTRLFCLSASSATFGTLVFLIMAVTLGETHRTYGNLSFARAFHGKVVFLTVGLTSWTYFSYRLLARKKKFSLLPLALVNMAMAGTTTSAIVMLPLLSIMLTIAIWMQLKSTPGAELISLGDIYKYLLVHLPIMMFGIEFYFYAKTNMTSGAAINVGFSTSFWDQLAYLTNRNYPVTWISFVLGAVVTVYLSTQRIFFAAWICVAFLLSLNPYVAPVIIKYVTTENIYWRLFYLLPFPIVLAVGAALFSDRCRTRSLRTAIHVATLLTTPLAISGPASVIRAENYASFGFPGYKIDPGLLSLTHGIAESAPHGRMLAPVEVANALVTITSKFPQFTIRSDQLRLHFSAIGDTDQPQIRTAASAFLAGDDATGTGIESIKTVINSPHAPRTIVISPSVTDRKELVSVLTERGFIKIEPIKNGWYLAVKTDS
jgi:hypothetical protein